MSKPDEEVVEAVAQEPEYKEKWQRALADLDNQRKQHEKDRSHISRFALESFLQELLPVVDNFYRATEHIPAEQQQTSWVTGIQYIQKNLLDTLDRQGVKEIQVKEGDDFDPALHEAISTEERDEEDKIVEVKNRGYMLHDRVLRPAQVIVSKRK